MNFLKDLDYQNVDNCIDMLKTYDFSKITCDDEFKIKEVFNKDNKVLFHVYWYGSISRKQLASINSYLKTQNLKTTELWVWLDSIYYNDEILKIPKHSNIKVISYDPTIESKGTLLNNKDYIYNKKFVKFRSDMARLIILYKYGGIYIDLDIFLLKDFTPLFGIEFCYSWSNLKQGNNAILRFPKQSNRLLKLMNKYIIFLSRYVEDFKFNVGMTHNNIFNDSLDLLCLPSTLFDPVWILFDTKSKSKYSNLTNFDAFFRKTDDDITSFFDNQIYAYHWHSRNDSKIEKDSYFEKLENL
jgi:hypothetical protein